MAPLQRNTLVVLATLASGSVLVFFCTKLLASPSRLQLTPVWVAGRDVPSLGWMIGEAKGGLYGPLDVVAPNEVESLRGNSVVSYAILNDFEIIVTLHQPDASGQTKVLLQTRAGDSEPKATADPDRIRVREAAAGQVVYVPLP